MKARTVIYITKTHYVKSHYRNVRGLGKGYSCLWFVDIQMKDQLNLRGFTKNRKYNLEEENGKFYIKYYNYHPN